MGDIKARAKDVVRYEAFGDAGGAIEELVAQLEKAEAERDDALARIAEIAAKAWDEGHDAGWNSRHDDAVCGWVPSGVHESDAVNPYRKAVQS